MTMGRLEYTRICIRIFPPDIICTLKVKWIIQSRWMDLHRNRTRSIQITTSRNPCKQPTCAPFTQPRILPSQAHTRIMEACVEASLFYIGIGIFWNWICWTRSRRSFDECAEDLLWEYHNRLVGKFILW